MSGRFVDPEALLFFGPMALSVLIALVSNSYRTLSGWLRLLALIAPIGVSFLMILTFGDLMRALGGRQWHWVVMAGFIILQVILIALALAWSKGKVVSTIAVVILNSWVFLLFAMLSGLT